MLFWIEAILGLSRQKYNYNNGKSTEDMRIKNVDGLANKSTKSWFVEPEPTYRSNKSHRKTIFF